MAPKSPPVEPTLAPSVAGSIAMQMPGAGEPLLRVDDHVARPETREELVRGRLLYAAPAKEPHAERHYELDYLLRGSMAPGYVGATDLLTRLGPGSDFATDTCIRRAGIDPDTGARHLEELAFEIVNTQSLRDITERAEDLGARGVRRVIAIFVETGEVREWSPSRGDWCTLDPSGTLEDPALVRPIPVAALIDAAEADAVVIRALEAKQSPELLAIEARGEVRGEARGVTRGVEEGKAMGRREGIEALCEVLGLELDAPRRAHLLSLDAAALEELLDRLRRDRRWPQR